MSIIFAAYTAPPSRSGGTLAGANGAPVGSFVQSGEVALLGRQSGPKFSATWELTWSLAGTQVSPTSAFYAADALRGTNGAPAGKFYQSSGALAATNGAPRGLFWNGVVLAGRAGAQASGFAAAPPTNGAVLQGSAPYPAWSSVSTYAETWDSALGALGAPSALFAQTGEHVLLARQRLPPSALFAQAVPVQNYVGMNLGLYAYVGAASSAPIQALTDRFMAHDTLDARFVLALLDLFNGSDAYRVMAQALQELADGATLADIAASVVQQQLLDALIGSAVLTDTAQLTFLLSDAFRPGDGTSMLSQVLEALADSFYAGLTLHSGGDLYTAWVMTPETKAMRSYSNFPFNSYAMLGGQLLGASATGIYRMGAPTDNGAAIQASIRTGLMNLGTQKLKRIDRAYLGATADGSLLLRVQATTASNGQLQQTYRMTPAQPGVPGEHRVDVGRGFRSVYWTFEIANDVDGADFELHNVQVLPLVLTGRVY